MRAPIWLLILVAGLIVVNTYTIIGTLNDIAVYGSLLPFAPIVRIVCAAAWIAFLIALLVGLLREKPTAFTLATPLLTLYGLVGLVWNAIFMQSTYSRGSQSFDILVTLIVLAPVWWIALRRSWLKTMIQSRGRD